MYAPKSPNSPFFDCWASGSPDNPQIQGSISPCISWNSTKSISTSFSHIKLHSTLTSHDFPIILPFCLSQNHGFPLRFSHPFPVQAPHLPPLCCRRWCWNCQVHLFETRHGGVAGVPGRSMGKSWGNPCFFEGVWRGKIWENDRGTADLVEKMIGTHVLIWKMMGKNERGLFF